jgi:hypothetical protein
MSGILEQCICHSAFLVDDASKIAHIIRERRGGLASEPLHPSECHVLRGVNILLLAVMVFCAPE